MAGVSPDQPTDLVSQAVSRRRERRSRGSLRRAPRASGRSGARRSMRRARHVGPEHGRRRNGGAARAGSRSGKSASNPRREGSRPRGAPGRGQARRGFLPRSSRKRPSALKPGQHLVAVEARRVSDKEARQPMPPKLLHHTFRHGESIANLRRRHCSRIGAVLPPANDVLFGQFGDHALGDSVGQNGQNCLGFLLHAKTYGSAGSLRKWPFSGRVT